MPNINNSYFDGYYKELWKILIPAILTEDEVKFMLSYFHLNSESKILDLMCGFGRHAIELGRRGMHVTALDNLVEYIDEITGTIEKEKLPVNAIKVDVLNYQFKMSYDLAICMGNSLNFFPISDIRKLLINVSSHLNPGGHLLIHTWSISEIVFTQFTPHSSSQVGDFELINDAKVLFQPTRLEINSTIINAEGAKETKKGIDYVCSLNEFEDIFKDAGMTMKAIFSVPGQTAFSIGDGSAYIVAQKV